MSYRQFLESLIAPIESFISWLGTIADYLLTNYVFITIFGLAIFSFILSFGLDVVRNFRIKKRNNDKYN